MKNLAIIYIFDLTNLLARFFSIIIFAQHLTIFGNSFSAFMPRGYMVCFHFG